MPGQYGYNPEKNQWIAQQTGYTGGFGGYNGERFGDWAAQNNIDTSALENQWQGYNQAQTEQANQPVTQQQQAPAGPSLAEITSGMAPRFDTLEGGQAQLGEGQAALAGNQGTIMENQGVLQGDIGAVGQGVAGVQGALGTPAEEGMTVFGQLGNQGQAMANLGNQFGTMAGQFDQFGNQLGDFQNLYEGRSAQTLSNLGDVREQGLQGRADLERQLQDMQPMTYNTNQGVQSLLSSPLMQSPMAPATQTATAPANQIAAGSNLNEAATNLPMGPTGPMLPDPRDAV